MTIKIENTCSATEYVKYDYGQLISCINTHVSKLNYIIISL